ncbi:ABC transporter ATP-binding protein [Aliidongia dinghuensis]|uniref:ABC transporter ATP-binding protein n=1 Tax=Aliidongia dinghuensis TaxID=1867774 RepID=A0A8J3E1X0_9PROT|nr:ABC transporter ATP-binding protein [Aliidongia dinghuensis]GGF05735.1 ABC transporter ATP-binding protein [Aliidongia dinghuensis]
MQPALIALEDATVTYGGIRAVDGISLEIRPGETLGLIGESGSGKSSLARLLVGLVRPSAGRVLFDGGDLARQDRAQRQRFRRDVQMIFQDPVASLSPRLTIRRLLAEPLAIHGIDEAKAWPGVLDLLRRVGLNETLLGKYPHQVSGGQARRVGIARALILRPRLVVADEPTAGLDVSVQGELVNLMSELQRDYGLTYLLVSHNLKVVRVMADRFAVMYLGQFVETGPAAEIFRRPAHPYTRALIDATPRLDPDRTHPPAVLYGEIPSPSHLPPGCRFQGRCPHADDHCRTVEPPPTTLADGRMVRCHKPLI